jgi:hypothetical protein
MIAAYVLFDPTNYFGGEQSIGNRWFLKAMPLALSLAVAAGVTERSGKAIALGAILFSALIIYPHHLDAVHAFQRCARSGLLQRYFPLETNQKFVVKLVEREGALVNISYVPQPPRWRSRIAREPQIWLWKNKQLVESPCSVRDAHEYLRIGGEQTFALFQQTESGTIYASYGFGHDGIFVSEKSRASLAGSCQSDGLAMALVPFGDTSGVTISSGRSSIRVALPAIVRFAPGGDSPNHFRQIDLVGDGYFWMLRGDQVEPAAIRTYRMDLD